MNEKKQINKSSIFFNLGIKLISVLWFFRAFILGGTEDMGNREKSWKNVLKLVIVLFVVGILSVESSSQGDANDEVRSSFRGIKWCVGDSLDWTTPKFGSASGLGYRNLRSTDEEIAPVRLDDGVVEFSAGTKAGVAKAGVAEVTYDFVRSQRVLVNHKWRVYMIDCPDDTGDRLDFRRDHDINDAMFMADPIDPANANSIFNLKICVGTSVRFDLSTNNTTFQVSPGGSDNIEIMRWGYNSFPGKISIKAYKVGTATSSYKFRSSRGNSDREWQEGFVPVEIVDCEDDKLPGSNKNHELERVK